MLRDYETPGWQRRAILGGDVDEPARGSRRWTFGAALALMGIVAAFLFVARLGLWN